MNVALFTDSDAFAGTERHMLELAEGLVGEGLRPAVACPARSPLASLAGRAGHQVIEIEKRGALDFRAVMALRRLLREGELDLIHSHNGRTHLISTLAAVAAGRGAIVTTQHFIAPGRVGRRGLAAKAAKTLHGWASRRTGGLIAVSTAVSRAVLERGDFPAELVAVIPNGIAAVDLGLMPLPEIVREKLGVAVKAPLLVCAARLEPEKDIDILITAMKQVVAVHPDAVCIIAGGGSLRDVLEAQVRSAGLSNSVRLLGHRRDVIALMRAADVFVLPSRAEPFGLVLLEAMGLACPVIATNAGGPAEIVVDGETGLLVPPRDPQVLAEKIKQLLDNPEDREALGQASLRRFEACYTASRMAKATAAVYRRAYDMQCVSNRRSRRTADDREGEACATH
jgi:glycosyltransferase involved in cell wall biosynthesis